MGATPSRAPPTSVATVSLYFEGDFSETVEKAGGLDKLQAAMKESLVNALQVDEWRIQNVTCSNGSIITTFSFLPPEEGKVNDTRTVLTDDIANLKAIVKSGNLVVKVGDQEIKVDKSREVKDVIIDDVITEESRTGDSR